MAILYITQNGITSHIGRSQVAPYLLGLARSGFVIKLLSAEPDGENKLIEHYEALFNEVGIRWTRIPYRNKPAILGPVLTQLKLTFAAHRIMSKAAVKIVHCRSHPAAIIGYYLKKRFGVNFIFDFRDFYADWGLQNTQGVKRAAYSFLKHLEGPMVRAADKIVCLTRRASIVLNDAYPRGDDGGSGRYQVIPCCADFSLFDLSNISSDTIRLTRDKVGLPESAYVLLYLGSLGTDYLLREMISLFRILLQLRPSAYFLFVSNNGEELVRLECTRQDVPADRIRFRSINREAVPAHIALANLSVVFIRADHTKVGCSPTKLAELFACNVPVIANGGVGDLDAIIDYSRNASVLVHDFTDDSLREALKRVITPLVRPGNLSLNDINIRENSREFALEEGVARYSRVYRELLNPQN